MDEAIKSKMDFQWNASRKGEGIIAVLRSFSNDRARLNYRCHLGLSVTRIASIRQLEHLLFPLRGQKKKKAYHKID